MYRVFLLAAILSGCSKISHESDVFPNGEWQPVNPEHFGKPEIQRIYEGEIPK